MSKKKLVVVGKLGAAHGVAGGVRMFSYTSPITNILDYDALYLGPPSADVEIESNWKLMTVNKISQHKDSFIVNFEGVRDRDIASSLTHSKIAVARDELDELDEDDFYWDDLLGIEVYNTDGVHLGVVDDYMLSSSF